MSSVVPYMFYMFYMSSVVPYMFYMFYMSSVVPYMFYMFYMSSVVPYISMSINSLTVKIKSTLNLYFGLFLKFILKL